MRRCAAIALGLAGCVWHDAAAQGAARRLSVDLMPGARVRLTVPATKPFVGTLLGATGDSVRVQLANGSSVTLPVSGLSGVELSTGVRRHGYKGALIGFVSGAAVGSAIGFATYRKTTCDNDSVSQILCGFVDETSRQVTVVGDAALVGVLGAAAGALIGHTGRESWVPVPTLGERTRIGMVRRSGLGIRIAM